MVATACVSGKVEAAPEEQRNPLAKEVASVTVPSHTELALRAIPAAELHISRAGLCTAVWSAQVLPSTGSPLTEPVDEAQIWTHTWSGLELQVLSNASKLEVVWKM